MDKKGQLDISVGLLLMTSIAIIVGLILFQTIAQQVGVSTNTQTITNRSLGVVNNLTTYYIPYRSISDVIIVNNTGALPILAVNYTVTNEVINPADGSLSVSIKPLSTIDWTGYTWKISGTVQPQTYIADSGARSVAGMIAVFFALAIAVVALEPTLRSKIIDMVR